MRKLRVHDVGHSEAIAAIGAGAVAMVVDADQPHCSGGARGGAHVLERLVRRLAVAVLRVSFRWRHHGRQLHITELEVGGAHRRRVPEEEAVEVVYPAQEPVADADDHVGVVPARQ